ncbi:MAG: hypothetical protein WDZ35_13905 [Crocinitomicaceae bacterium]
MTDYYIFNETGLMGKNSLEKFVLDLKNELEKCSIVAGIETINEEKSTIYSKIMGENLTISVFDHGFVIKIESDHKLASIVLLIIRSLISKEVEFYLSPTQRLDKNNALEVKHDVDIRKCSLILDSAFNNNEYSSALEM